MKALLFTLLTITLCLFMSFIDKTNKKEKLLEFDLPEEYKLISKDSSKPSIMIAYYKKNTIILGFKH